MVEATAFVDRSAWGRIRMTGADRLRFLHNQTTNDFQQRRPGEGCETVFVTSTARTLDLVSAYVDDDSVLLLTSPEMAVPLIEWMDRYIFFADKVDLEDCTADTCALTLFGPSSDDVLAQLGLPQPEAAPHSHLSHFWQDQSLKIARGTGLAVPGYTLIGPRELAQPLNQALLDQGLTAWDSDRWETLRIQQGRPLPHRELTPEDNPLEAGLWHTISFEKGCYIGQETIARLNTYQGVKKQLWGLQLSQPVPTDTPITLGGKTVGRLTSVATVDGRTQGLGYVRTKAGGVGLTVQVGDATATLTDIPLASRGYLSSGDAAEKSSSPTG